MLLTRLFALGALIKGWRHAVADSCSGPKRRRYILSQRYVTGEERLEDGDFIAYHFHFVKAEEETNELVRDEPPVPRSSNPSKQTNVEAVKVEEEDCKNTNGVVKRESKQLNEQVVGNPSSNHGTLLNRAYSSVLRLFAVHDQQNEPARASNNPLTTEVKKKVMRGVAALPEEHGTPDRNEVKTEQGYGTKAKRRCVFARLGR
eukprot:766168-Hanusia_phi.AAC.5